MKNMKVYIVDSSVLVRQTAANIIQKMDGVEVAGSSAIDSISDVNRKIGEEKPTAVVMGMDHLDSLESELFLTIRENFPDLPVLILSPRSMQGGEAAIFALKNGAFDYVTKPSKPNNLLLAYRHLEKRLHQCLKMIPRMNPKFLTRKMSETGRVNSNDKIAGSILKRIDRSVELVMIGGCTGGVQSLLPVISSLPADLPVPVVIIQHMPKIYTRVLADELDSVTALNVREATFDSMLLPGQVYLVPGGYHASVRNSTTRKQLTLHRGPKEHRCRPSIDVFLRSAVQVYKSRVLTVFLSGSGRDGLLGARKSSSSGGQVLIQDKATSLLWDTPGEIHECGIDDGVYSIDDLSMEIAKRVEIKFDKVQYDPALQFKSGKEKGSDDFVDYSRI